MKVLILSASGNTDGFTRGMCDRFRGYAAGCGHESETVDLHAMDIGDCSGCRSCKNGKGCVLHDDMESLFSGMESADLLVFATPIRFSGPSSILKRFIDRLNPCWYSGCAPKGYACALMCGGSPEPEFSHARSEMVSASAVMGRKWLGECRICGTDSSGSCGDETEYFAKDVLALIGK